MKKIKNGIFCLSLLVSQFVYASNGSGSARNLPWEKPVEIVKDSLFYIGGLFVLIGILWAGYAFLAQQEKEAGFKRMIGTFIGGSVIFGAQAIVTTLFGASF